MKVVQIRDSYNELVSSTSMIFPEEISDTEVEFVLNRIK